MAAEKRPKFIFSLPVCTSALILTVIHVCISYCCTTTLVYALNQVRYRSLIYKTFSVKIVV